MGFESTEFVVGEGSGLVSLNVSLLEGDLTGVSVTLGASTVQGSATCKQNNISALQKMKRPLRKNCIYKIIIMLPFDLKLMLLSSDSLIRSCHMTE